MVQRVSELMKLLRGGAKEAIEDNTGQRSNKTFRRTQNQDKTSRWDDASEDIKGLLEWMETEG